MRLNLGCGPYYRQGFINVDAFDVSVADLRCGLTSLPFADESFERVECMHAIEHLGAIEAIAALSECYRVMKHSAVLVLETPDIEASFGKFLGDRSMESRSSLLTWIFGHDTPGQRHRMLYPERLLRIMLKEAGFAGIRLQGPRTHLYREGIRVWAVRRGSAADRVMACFRHRAAARGITGASSHFQGLEWERFFIRNIRSFHADPKKNRSRIFDNMVYSPEGVRLWLEAAAEGGAGAGAFADFSALLKLAQRLEELGLPARLIDCFHRMIDSAPVAGDGYDHVFSMARGIVEKLAGKSKRKTVSIVRNQFPCKVKAGGDARAFSRTVITEQVGRMRDRGVRYMLEEKYAEAAPLLRRAVNAGIESFYSIVNYAILNALFEKYDESIRLYGAALTHDAGAQVEDRVREELIKCLLLRGRRGEAMKKAGGFRTKRLGGFWKAVLTYHGGRRAQSLAMLRALARGGFEHELLKRYLSADEKGRAGGLGPPAPRKEPMITGELVLHKL
ncbi:MAG: methyltransferase domain-containing protein [Pseudomonadota bacterium]